MPPIQSISRGVALLVLSALAGAARADATEGRLRASVERLPPADQAFFAKAQYGGEYRLSELVSFSSADGRVAARFHLPERLTAQLADPAPLLLALEGSPHVWAVHRRKSGTLDAGFSLVTLTCYAPEQAWPFNRYTLSSDGQGVMVSAAQIFGHPASQQTLSMTQGDRGPLNLAWRLEADRFVAGRAQVANLGQVPTRVPSLMERYLLPVLRRLGPARAASDVYRAFDQIPADLAAVKAVAPLLEKLDADDPRARDAAIAALKDLGRPAILACLRTDPATLSAEQRNRLEGFYAAEGWIHVPDVETARTDPDFVEACLEDEDPAVRQVATNMLAALRAVRPARR